MSPILVLGLNGLLGSTLVRQFPHHVIGLNRQQCDLQDQHALAAALRQFRPAALINAAGYTHVDQAESDASTCYQANSDAVQMLAETCDRADCLLVQVSTNFVFHGSSDRKVAFVEEEDCNPLGVYASSKYRAEHCARRAGKHLVVRTCGLYSHLPAPGQRKHFVQRILELASTKPTLQMIDDQHMTPTYVPHLAAAIEYLVGLRLANEIPNGTFHLTNAGATTWFEFTRELFRIAGISTHIQPISTDEYAAPAPRPAFSVLDVRKYLALGGPPMPDWRDALQEWQRSRTANCKVG